MADTLQSSPARAAGMSLVELMVAMTIGLVLIAGALRMYSQSRATMMVTDNLSRMQENARFALETLEPDLLLANFWGLHTATLAVERRAGTTNPITATTPVTGDCEPDWSINLDAEIEGFNQVHPGWTCLSEVDHKDETDILVVRHAGEDPVTAGNLQAGVLYLRSDESPRAQLFHGADPEPGGFSPLAENHTLLTAAYYIRPYTVADPNGRTDNVPSLRRLILTDGGAGPAVEDREVISGVEDLQVQFGVDTSAIGAPIDLDDIPGAGSANRYVDADNAILANPDARIVSVRLWLLVRALEGELNFDDDARYTYADVDYTIDGRADMPQGFRRVLVSRTFELRNM